MADETEDPVYKEWLQESPEDPYGFHSKESEGDSI